MKSLHAMTAVMLITSMPSATFALDNSRINDFMPLERNAFPMEQDVLAGMVLQDTMTRTGEAFYRGFASAWQAAEHTFPGTVMVTERPSARWGSLIRVSLNSEVIHESVIQGHGNDAATLGRAAAGDIHARLGTQLITGTLFAEDADLGRREF